MSKIVKKSDQSITREEIDLFRNNIQDTIDLLRIFLERAKYELAVRKISHGTTGV